MDPGSQLGPGCTQLLPAESRTPPAGVSNGRLRVGDTAQILSLKLSPELPQASCGCYVAARPGKGQARGTERGASLTSLSTML